MTRASAQQFIAKAEQLRATVVHVADRSEADGVLTDLKADVVVRASFAVAETGSVGLVLTPAQRAECFLSSRLAVVVSESAVLADLDAALRRIAAEAQAHRDVTLMSGPSRTADIERTLTIGVHGPRELVIVVLAT